MARKPPSGAKALEAANLTLSELNALSMKELRTQIGYLRSAVNKRMVRLEKASEEWGESPALKSFQRSGGVISTKGKNLNQLREEYARARYLFNLETSTVRGFKEVQEREDRRLFGEDISGNPLRRMTPEERKDYWKMVDKWRESGKGIENNVISSDRIQQIIIDLFLTSKTFDIEDINAMIDKAYKEEQDKNEYEKTSFTELDDGVLPF